MTKKPYTLSEIDPSFDWPPGLQLVFDRVLAQAPAERFESAGQFAEEFLQVVQSSFGGIA